ncbi:MAG: FprA family A-type flavoprotein [Desulfovibrio sp.]|nr:FprA family A-type flavoprotein [Desulfovibrio sp.]MCA1986155.1 FprA family A-type flavoprotein [Desulfovibrio sp.]
MQATKIIDGFHLVGAIDWNSRDFHGYTLSPMGTTYNAYLVEDEKTTLFDTVKAEYKGELLCGIASVIDPKKIDYLVIQHLELDHAGALPALIEACQPEKIFTSSLGQKAMESHFHYKDWPVQVVKHGETLSLGKRTVTFYETRMLHWPDSMVSWFADEKVLISNDIFGQNIAASERFSDQIPIHTMERAMREYYANIVNPYAPQTLKAIETLVAAGVAPEYICPDHGVIFRGADQCAFAVQKYVEFAEQKPTNKVVIFYDTMWHSTEKMARVLAECFREEGCTVKLMWCKACHHSQIMSEISDAGAVVVGCPTHNNGILPYVAGTLQYIKGLRPQNKIGGAFGSFGWSGESTKVLAEWLTGMGFDMPATPVKVKNVPTHADYEQLKAMAQAIAKALKARL